MTIQDYPDNKSFDHNRLRLSDSVNAHDSLIFDSGIPPRILKCRTGISWEENELWNLPMQTVCTNVSKWPSTSKNAFEAAVRFNPTPPAFRDNNIIWSSVAKIVKTLVGAQS